MPTELVSALETKRVAQLEKFRFTYEQFEKLKATADHEGIQFLSTPFDLGSVAFLAPLVPAFKIASGDNDFYPLIEVIAEIGKPIIMSTGLLNLDEIEKSVLFIKNIWQKNHNKRYKKNNYSYWVTLKHSACFFV